MGKYDSLKILIKRKARVNHNCTSCGEIIKAGEFYYSEELKDKHINFIHRKKLCDSCYKNSMDKIG
jgi:hypothetical protein